MTLFSLKKPLLFYIRFPLVAQKANIYIGHGFNSYKQTLIIWNYLCCDCISQLSLLLSKAILLVLTNWMWLNGKFYVSFWASNFDTGIPSPCCLFIITCWGENKKQSQSFRNGLRHSIEEDVIPWNFCIENNLLNKTLEWTQNEILLCYSWGFLDMDVRATNANYLMYLSPLTITLAILFSISYLSMFHSSLEG